jgi:serine/threonine-protein kinase RsbW
VKAGSFSISIVSDISMVRDTVREILDFIRNRVCLREDMEYDIKLILNELLLNAIVHGNRHNRDKSVDIKVDILKDGKMQLAVNDQGEGFDYPSYRQRYPILNPERECGRGLNIIHRLSDEVRFNKKGNEVVVIKILDDQKA